MEDSCSLFHPARPPAQDLRGARVLRFIQLAMILFKRASFFARSTRSSSRGYTIPVRGCNRLIINQLS